MTKPAKRAPGARPEEKASNIARELAGKGKVFRGYHVLVVDPDEIVRVPIAGIQDDAWM
jgi:hypothetical protein